MNFKAQVISGLRYGILLCCLIWMSMTVDAQVKKNYFDGPYIFDQADSLRIQWVEHGIGYDTMIRKDQAIIFQRDSLPVVNLQDLGFITDNQASYSGVEKLVSLSDVHGQYDILIQLLKTHHVIGEENNWKYGTGHLMVIGDNFDRGDKVLDILWFLFHLQKEAHKAGGKVHVLLGNHEMMVLQGDLRYLHRKYRYTSGYFRTTYDQFFRKGSVLGDWLASHKVFTSINKNLFVHAGVSDTLLDLGYPIDEMNEIFRDQIIRQPEDSIYKDSVLSLLYMDQGPLWYRGYFDSAATNSIIIDDILGRLDQNKVIVGHTSLEEIQGMQSDKIIAIDCSIKLGYDGQVLILENNEFTIGELDGSRIALHEESKPHKNSLFNHIYNLGPMPRFKITTNLSTLIKKSEDEKYQPATFHLSDQARGNTLDLNCRIRSRGNMRKKVCWFPPVKIDFSKSVLDSLGFQKIDKLKLVLPCNNRNTSANYLYKEYFLYTLYSLIDTNCLRAKLIDLTLAEENEDKYQFVGFMIEHEKEYARRKNAKIIEIGKVRAGALDRESFLKMAFFQYMICNTDWTVANKHNLEIVKLPGIDRVVGIPYDFDYSGFVGQEYATPAPTLPIESVHVRYFHKYLVTEKEFYRMVNYYLSIEKAVYKHCDDATYMSAKTIKANKAYLASFFKLLRKPERLKGSIVRKN